MSLLTPVLSVLASLGEPQAGAGSPWSALLSGHELDFLVRLAVALLCGLCIGVERELRLKPAGISTHSLVIGGAATFAYAAVLLQPADPTRITAQIVTGVGFLGAGVILRTADGSEVTNLTTAASLWFSAGVGVLIGLGFYALAGLATVFAVSVPCIPRVRRRDRATERGGKQSQR